MGLTIEEALERGIEALKAGQFQDADRFFNSILEVQPKHPDANHNMGMLAVSVGQVEKALPFFRTALESNPDVAQYWLSHIDALIKLEAIDDARTMVAQAKEEGVEGEAFTKLEQSMVQFSKGGGRADSDNGNSTRSEINILDTKSLNQALRIAKRRTKEGFNEDAKRIYQNIIDRFPKNIRAIHGIKALSEGVADEQVKNQNPGEIQLRVLQELYSKGQLRQVLIQAKQMLHQFPKSFVLYSVLGAANAGLKNYDVAISNYKQALKINPGDADAYYNMGITLKAAGDLEGAIGNYKQALEFNPGHADAHNNLGNALKAAGDLEGAIDNYKQALKINPGQADAYNNMGIAQQAAGDLEDAIGNYKRALKINPGYGDAQSNLISLLTNYSPQKDISHPILKVEQEIRNIGLKYKPSKKISDSQVVEFVLAASNAINDSGLELDTKISQIYRRDAIDRNCLRHEAIFKEHQIIPEFCFGCYKVQVEPRTFLELIKLVFVFDQMQLENNNSRKCMVELRSEVGGFYKGLVYCSGLAEANQIANYLDALVDDSIGSGLSASVKRGCSEYPLVFPQYKEINQSGPQLMSYNEDWKTIEASHDAKYPLEPDKNLRPSLRGISLSDILILQNWRSYAEGIGDKTADLITKNNRIADRSKEFFARGKERIDMYSCDH